MKLNKQHRRILLSKLKEVQKELLLSQKSQQIWIDKEDIDMVDYMDIEIYLLQEKINTIETSLIEDEIDY